jgi:uncharacterized protein involved in exopolysaccharide biosynthesis
MGREGGEWRRDLAAVGADLRPRYSLSEWSGLLWRERVLMALVFALVFALGTAGVLFLPKTYVARSSLLVRLGQEYVYQPRAGDAARGAIPQTTDMVQSEAEILSSDELKRRVIRTVGLDTLDPRLAAASANAADETQRRRVEGSAVRILTQGLKIDTAPDTGVVRLSFQHKDPQAAATVLNALVDTYLTYRHDVLSDRETPLLGQEKAAFEARLARADAAYEAFQTANGVGDLPSEKASLAVLRQSVLDDRYKAEADLSAAQSRLAALSRSVQAAPAEIEIQRDLDLSATSKLLQLRMERRDLLSRYKPNAAPVKEVDAKIAELEAFAASPNGAAEKDRRLGANPVRQDLERQRIGAAVDLAAAARRRDELSRQLDEITTRQQKLTALETRYQDLSVEREVLQANLRAFAQREEETRAAQELAHGGDDSIRVVQRASAPVEGTSLRQPMFVLAAVFAAFTAACAGLMRVVLRRGFVTPEAAGRVLDLPVLASAPLKAS